MFSILLVFLSHPKLKKNDCQNIYFVYIILFIQYSLHAQGAQSSIYPSINNGWQFTFSPTLSSREKIKPNYTNTSELNVYSKPTWGFNAQITRHLSINDKSFFAIGGSLGFYKADIGYNFSSNLLDSIKLINYSPDDYDNYGLTFHYSASAKYCLKIWETSRTDFFSNFGLGFNYMMASFYGFGGNNDHLSAFGVFNENRKPFLSGTLDFHCGIKSQKGFILFQV